MWICRGGVQVIHVVAKAIMWVARKEGKSFSGDQAISSDVVWNIRTAVLLNLFQEKSNSIIAEHSDSKYATYYFTGIGDQDTAEGKYHR